MATANSNELNIVGARQNNLKNISVRIPHDQVTVVTGVSGSGKSSLAFDTIFAEGQWRYIESLSTYARMFLEKLDRPDVDRLEHIRPAIAIEQKNPVRNSRSTVGTATEMADLLRLLFAKIGRPFCPDCGAEVRAYYPGDVADTLLRDHAGSRALVLFPLVVGGPSPEHQLQELMRRGFWRLQCDDGPLDLVPELLTELLPRLKQSSSVSVILDRLIIGPRDRARLVEAIETAFREGGGTCLVDVVGLRVRRFSQTYGCQSCGRNFALLRPALFSFNHPLGACPTCKGFGNILRYDEDLIVPHKNKSLAEGAVAPWTKPSGEWWQKQMVLAFKQRGFDLMKPYSRFNLEERQLLWEGTTGKGSVLADPGHGKNGLPEQAGGGRVRKAGAKKTKIEGIHVFFSYLEGKRYKLHVRVLLSRYRSPFMCESCRGARLKSEALAVRIGGRSIAEVCDMTVTDAADWVKGLTLSRQEQDIAKDVVKMLDAKLGFLLRVGLGYLMLSRLTRTLSGGEAQRISLATHLGSHLTGTLYVLDEPTIGLHTRDTHRLAGILHDLAKAGNTVVMVEHDRAMIQAADFVVEMGPAAGQKGGEVVAAARFPEFLRDPQALTARYLRGEETIPLPRRRRSGSGYALVLIGAQEHNLKNITVRIPLGTLTCVTGVSGSGKSTLVQDTLYSALARTFRLENRRMGRFEAIRGIEQVAGVRLIDQEPIGRTPRSNPVTYLKAFDDIRRLYAARPDARRAGLKAGDFSFNTPGGRCEACQGTGLQKLEMYFFEDMYMTCEVCEGRRFKLQVLTVKYRDASIYDVLNMTVTQALSFFSGHTSICAKLWVLSSIGLGYLRLGQSATTLSGGEAQRLKIASELVGLPSGRKVRDGILYIMDEPTTGLHLDDVKKLLLVINRLVEVGHTVLVVEHNLELIKSADWIIDLGPEGGERGGEVIAMGTPEAVMKERASYTGQALTAYL